MQKNKYNKYIFLHILLFLYSISALLSKIASEEVFLSAGYFTFYLASVFFLIIYALLWQQILKLFPLSVAFANKGIVIVWGMLWGAFFLNEQIKWNMLLGAVIVFVGIILVVNSDG